MKKNVGTVDKIIRLLVATVLAILYFTGVVSGTLGIVLLIVAVVFAATAFIGFCGLYTLLGISTCPVKRTRS
jgi:hypothetical protein